MRRRAGEDGQEGWMRTRGRRRWATVLGGEKSAKGATGEGLRWRPVESDEERAARVRTREKERKREREREREGEEKERQCDAREGRAEETWARIERERGRRRQIPCLTRLGSMRSSARTPRRPRPSFLPSFSLLCSSLPPPAYLTRSAISFFLSLSASSPFPPSVFLLVPLLPSLSVPPLLSFFLSRSLSVAPSREFRPPCFHVVLLTLTPVLLYSCYR